MTDSHSRKEKQEEIQNALTNIDAFVVASKDKERAIRTLLGFCLKRRLAQDAINVFTYLKGMTHLSKDTFRMLTGVLHLLVESPECSSLETGNDSQKVSSVFDFLKSKNLVDESTYSIIVKYHSRDRPNVAFDVILEMKSLGIWPHLRSYRILLECAPDLAYLDKVYESLSDDIMVASSEEKPKTEDPDAVLYDDESDESPESKRSEHLMPDADTFYAIFANLKKFSLDSMASCPRFKHYLMEYRKYHTTMDSRIGALIESMVSNAKKVNIEPDGTVTGFRFTQTTPAPFGRETGLHYKLQSMDISGEQQEELLGVLHEQNKKAFDAFDLFMNRRSSIKTYDVVLDGANIALYNNTDFLAWKVIKAVIAYMKKGKKVLIILSRKRRDQELIQFVTENKDKVDIYWCTGVYDDLVWLYASIKASCPIVTNDKMTDHIYYVFPTEKGSPPVFKVWMERHQVTYDFNIKGQIQLHEPSTYSCRIQLFIDAEECETWFLPVSDQATEGEASNTYQWLMLRFKSQIGATD